MYSRYQVSLYEILATEVLFVSLNIIVKLLLVFAEMRKLDIPTSGLGPPVYIPL